MRYAVAPLMCVFAFVASAQDASNVVVVCPVNGVIDEGVAVVVERALDEARDLNAKAIIFRIDTPGGLVDAAIRITTAIQKAPCTTIAYIEGMGAISAGALISYACDHLVMTPGSNIGAATPVIPSAEGMKPLGEKETSFVRAKMRALAESNGHNPSIAEAMVDKDIELRGKRDESGSYVVYAIQRVGDPKDEAAEEAATQQRPEPTPVEKILEAAGVPAVPIATPQAPAEPVGTVDGTRSEPGIIVFEDGSELVLPSGKLLTLTPDEAKKYGVIKFEPTKLEDVAEFLQFGPVTYHEIVPNWAEKFFRWVTSPAVAGLLLMLGIGGLYLEIKAPGLSVPGILGVACLALFFGSHYIIGLADVIDIVLVLTGIILVLVEIFVLPGFGLAGGIGIACIAVGVYLSLVNFTIPEFSWEFDRLWNAVTSMAVACASFIVFVVATWRILPHTPLYSRLVQTGTQDVEDGFTVQPAEVILSAIGLEGVASSMLRPAGKGRFHGRTYDIISHGDFVAPGTPVRIVEVDGNRYVVDPIEEAKAS